MKSLSRVQTLHEPMDCSLPGSSAHGIFQARVLEWGAIAFSKEYLKNIYIYFDLSICNTHIFNLEIDVVL